MARIKLSDLLSASYEENNLVKLNTEQASSVQGGIYYGGGEMTGVQAAGAYARCQLRRSLGSNAICGGGGGGGRPAAM